MAGMSSESLQAYTGVLSWHPFSAQSGCTFCRVAIIWLNVFLGFEKQVCAIEILVTTHVGVFARVSLDSCLLFSMDLFLQVVGALRLLVLCFIVVWVRSFSSSSSFSSVVFRVVELVLCGSAPRAAWMVRWL